MSTSSELHWEQLGSDQAARRGRLHTQRGVVETPAFMPVGTRATVRALDVTDLEQLGVQMVLANTYHLMLRPGAEVVAQLGGLHRFWGWSGPILTDSGGYQIFSLEPKITETEAIFRSTYDGSTIELSPERAVQIQQQLGSDIAMVLDQCVGLPASPEVVRAAMERTLRWSERCRDSADDPNQTLFGIVQGGTSPELRAESAARTAALGFRGYAIGGLSVGEDPTDRNLAIEAAVTELPSDRVRYFMGLGDADGVMEAVARGVDLFDCVWPTRLARHGRILSPDGDYNLRQQRFLTDPEPLHAECKCSTCQRYSRAYLRHLLMVNELTVFRLLTIHNLAYTLELMRTIRSAITDRNFDSTVEKIGERRNSQNL